VGVVAVRARGREAHYVVGGSSGGSGGLTLSQALLYGTIAIAGLGGLYIAALAAKPIITDVALVRRLTGRKKLVAEPAVEEVS
jgi:hypothetical protein